MVPAVADRTGLGEAEVVITGRGRTTNDAAHVEASSLRSLRKRLLGMPKTAEIDAASHAGYLDNVEEASVEIVRAGTEGVKLSPNLRPLGTPRNPQPSADGVGFALVPQPQTTRLAAQPCAPVA